MTKPFIRNLLWERLVHAIDLDMHDYWICEGFAERRAEFGVLVLHDTTILFPAMNHDRIVQLIKSYEEEKE